MLCVWIKGQILYYTVVWFIVYMTCSMNPMLLVKELVDFIKREYVIVIVEARVLLVEVIDILGQCFLKLIVQFNRSKGSSSSQCRIMHKNAKTLPF